MHVRLIGDSKLSLGVSVSVHGCLSRLSLCGPVMDWRSVQGVPRLSPNDSWDWLQLPHDPTDGLSGYRKWMDGWMERYRIYLSCFVLVSTSEGKKKNNTRDKRRRSVCVSLTSMGFSWLDMMEWAPWARPRLSEVAPMSLLLTNINSLLSASSSWLLPVIWGGEEKGWGYWRGRCVWNNLNQKVQRGIHCLNILSMRCTSVSRTKNIHEAFARLICQ